MTARDKPYFRFNPVAYDDEVGSFEETSDACGICDLPCVWRYTGSVYMIGEPPTMCARCLANGALATLLPSKNRDAEVAVATFGFHDIDLEDALAELETELLTRTPGVACFNPFAWPVINGEPLAFVGRGYQAHLHSDQAVMTAMNAACKQHWSDVPDTMLNRPSADLLIFRTLDGAHARAVLDHT